MGKNKCEAGAPAWLLTYGDMITLVLCFFVILFSMSEIRKDRITHTMRHFQAQFGVLPAQRTTVQIFQQPQIMTMTETFVLRRGPPGTHPAVMTIREAERTRVTIGAADLFRPDSAELTPSGKAILREVAPDLRGYTNRIDVRGHTASSAYQDGWFLGFQRAYAVMEYLTSPACRVEERRFRVTSVGANDPVADNVTEEGRRRNRRVEIIMSEDQVTGLGELTPGE